jgi:hypothetical protein
MTLMVSLGVCSVGGRAQQASRVGDSSTANPPTARDPYARYVTPGWCEAAAARADTLYWRDKRPDTVVYAPLTDSVPASVRETARTCGARFTVATTPVSELLPLVQLSLWAGLDERAREAAAHLLAAQAQATPTQRGWILQLLVQEFLEAKPTRLTDAKRYLAQLDALGAPAGEWRAITHMHMGDLLASLGDIPGADTEYHLGIVGANQMSKDDRMNSLDHLEELYSHATEMVSAERGGAATLAFLDSAYHALAPLRPAGEIDGLFRYLNGVYRLVGTQGPRLTASHWYTTDSDTVRPRPGRVSLIVWGTPDCGASCYGQYAVIRRVAAKYGSALQTTIVTGTGGFYRNHAMPTPAAESDSTKHYFLDFLNLPVGIAVNEVSFSFRADGRRVDQETKDSRNYDPRPYAAVVGADGIIRFMVKVGPAQEKILDRMIAASQK